MNTMKIDAMESELPKISNILSKLSVIQPILTVPLINDIAEECGISYDNMVHHIQTWRVDGADMKHCILDLIYACRPDV